MKKLLIIFISSVIIAGCKTSNQSSAVSDPHSVGAILMHQNNRSSMEKYDQLMGDKPVIPLNDYKHRAIVKHYMIKNVIKPLQTVKGLYLEELVDRRDMTIARVTICTDLLFPATKGQLSQGADNLLRPIAELLRKEKLMVITINCHSERSKIMNVATLTQGRAETVATRLVGMGVARGRILAAYGCGDEQPVATNDNAEGRTKNRRIEVYICPDKNFLEQVCDDIITLAP